MRTLQQAYTELLEASGGRYSFELDTYINNSQTIKCTCNVCGHVFYNSYKNLVGLRNGCRVCARKRVGVSQRLSISDVTQRLTDSSRGRYTFELRDGYSNSDSRVYCKCNTCDYEWSNKYCHLANRGQGCPKCAKTLRLTLQEAKCNLVKVANGRYSFVMLDYKNNHQKIKCKCNTCEYEWESSYGSLIYRATGCAMCAIRVSSESQRLDLNDAYQRLLRASQGRYSFVLNEYRNIYQPVSCQCFSCGCKWSTAYSHLVSHNSGCPECAKVKIRQQNQLALDKVAYRLLVASRGEYSFQVDDYQGTHSHIRCKCNACGLEWSARFANLTYPDTRTGCPNQCYKQQLMVSKPEHEITEYIKQNFPQLEVQQSVRSLIKNPQGTHAMEVDIYIPELRLAFEFNGTYWHSDEYIANHKKGFISAQQYHDYKTQQCTQKGVKLVHIDETEYVADKQKVLDTIKQEIGDAHATFSC